MDGECLPAEEWHVVLVGGGAGGGGKDVFVLNNHPVGTSQRSEATTPGMEPRLMLGDVLTIIEQQTPVLDTHLLRQRRHRALEVLLPRLGVTQVDHVGAHCSLVGHLAGQLATVMGLPRGVVDDVTVAGELHDIGKCTVPEWLLALPRKLTDAEWHVMTTHTEFGALLAKRLGASATITAAVRMHHDRFDTGAPLMARLLNVADALTTMTSDREYQRAIPLDDALAELQKGAGGQFDPRVVEAAHSVATARFRRAA